MTKWLHSGRRRDACAILYDAGELRPQQLKHRLTSHYDERIDPQSFRAMLASLEEAGFVTFRTEGIADRYRLTDAGERALLDHYEWLQDRVESGSPSSADGGSGRDGDGDGDSDGDGDGDSDGDGDGNAESERGR